MRSPAAEASTASGKKEEEHESNCSSSSSRRQWRGNDFEWFRANILWGHCWTPGNFRHSASSNVGLANGQPYTEMVACIKRRSDRLHPPQHLSPHKGSTKSNFVQQPPTMIFSLTVESYSPLFNKCCRCCCCFSCRPCTRFSRFEVQKSNVLLTQKKARHLIIVFFSRRPLNRLPFWRKNYRAWIKKIMRGLLKYFIALLVLYI